MTQDLKKVELNINEWNLIVSYVQEGKHKDVNTVLVKIYNQLTAQQNKEEKEPEPIKQEKDEQP